MKIFFYYLQACCLIGLWNLASSKIDLCDPYMRDCSAVKADYKETSHIIFVLTVKHSALFF